MEVYRRSSWLLLLLFGVSLLAATLQGVQGEDESEGPSESECRPYIEKALKELETGETTPTADNSDANGNDSKEDIATVEITTDDSEHGDDNDTPDDNNNNNNVPPPSSSSSDDDGQQEAATESVETQEQSVEDTQEATSTEETKVDKSEESKADDGESQETPVTGDETDKETDEEHSGEGEKNDDENDTKEEKSDEESVEKVQESVEDVKESVEDGKESVENDKESIEDVKENVEDVKESVEDVKESVEGKESVEEGKESVEDTKESKEDGKDSVEEVKDSVEEAKDSVEEGKESVEEDKGNVEDGKDSVDSKGSEEKDTKEEESVEEATTGQDSKEAGVTEDISREAGEDSPVEELSLDTEIPTNLRSRDYVEQLLKLDDESSDVEQIIERISDITLRELKKLYENAIKPLETLYKYRDLSNRHFGDAEIYSKPLILFMGPWSGGKSSIINYLVDNEYNETSLRTGAEPSPAYFNILMHGDEPEVLDGTQLVADFTFSGLQKFGQGLEERLRGYKLPSKLLEKVNIVEIPGILEVRKQVSRVFPFNDACQWFIDRADIIFLVYDPSKLDVGPETEAILDQLKGREHQTRILLNKADQVKPEELMRVQGALIWNISPLMSSPQPPVMYTVSLWSRPYENWAPVRLLQAQERAFLRDLRTAVDKRIDNKIASARRFAVRVRNHAKMVDCYLTTYYNHKSVFGNRKQVADEIIEHPQDYHIYEGLSTLTNISRYDLPDPEVYKDFFKLNPLYDFQQLSATCTYFRGCPINRLDVAIAYDLPELIGKHKRLVEAALAEANPTPGS